MVYIVSWWRSGSVRRWIRFAKMPLKLIKRWNCVYHRRRRRWDAESIRRTMELMILHSNLIAAWAWAESLFSVFGLNDSPSNTFAAPPPPQRRWAMPRASFDVHNWFRSRFFCCFYLSFPRRVRALSLFLSWIRMNSTYRNLFSSTNVDLTCECCRTFDPFLLVFRFGFVRSAIHCCSWYKSENKQFAANRSLGNCFVFGFFSLRIYKFFYFSRVRRSRLLGVRSICVLFLAVEKFNWNLSNYPLCRPGTTNSQKFWAKTIFDGGTRVLVVAVRFMCADIEFIQSKCFCISIDTRTSGGGESALQPVMWRISAQVVIKIEVNTNFKMVSDAEIDGGE